MKKFLLLCLTTLVSVATWAYSFEVEGIYYNKLSDTTAEICPEVVEDPATYYTGDFVIPANVTYGEVQYTVVSIGEECFYNSPITSVYIPETITTFKDYAFDGCKSLTAVDIPTSVTSIGEAAFTGCSALTSITFPNTVTNIDIEVCNNCSGLTEVTIGNAVTNVDQNAFHNCTNLSKFTSLNPTPPTLNNSGFQGVDLSNVTLYVPSGSKDTYSKTTNWSAFTNIEEISEGGDEGGTPLPNGTNFEVDGIHYNVISSENQTIEIIYDSSYTGDFVIPESVTYEGVTYTVVQIGEDCFNNSSITSVVIPETITTFKDYAFCGCKNLVTVDIPNSVTSIGESIFYNCTALTSITFPNSITYLNYAACMSCSGIEEATIGNAVTNVDQNAFFGCTSLLKFTSLNPTPPTATNNSFTGGWQSNATLYVPSGSKSSYSSATYWEEFGTIEELSEGGDEGGTTLPNGTRFNTGGVYYDVVSAEERTVEVTYLYYDDTRNSAAYRGSVVIPETVTYEDVTYDVVGIGEYAFYQCTSMTSISIPNSVTYIDTRAFYYSGLTSLVIPDSVMEVGDEICFHSESLASVVLGEGVTTITPHMFRCCYPLNSVTMSDNVTTIDRYAFRQCTSLKSLEFSKGLTTINQSAFYECTALTSVDLPAIVTSIGEGAFEECTALQKAYIGESLTSIGVAIFYDCVSLEEVNIPSGVTSIDEYAFSYCSKLNSVDIPSGVTFIGDYAFYGCSKVTSITLPSGLTSIGRSALYATGIYSVDIPETVTAIGPYAFGVCPNLESVKFNNNITTIPEGMCDYDISLIEITLPSDVTSIETLAFNECTSLESVTIGALVESIGKEAFFECENLKKFTSYSPEPPSCDTDAFEFLPTNSVLYVPVGSKEDYSTAFQWENFGSIVEMTEFAVETYDATDVTDVSAVLHGYAVENYLEPGSITSKGFVYWSNDPDQTTTVTVTGGDAEMSYTLESLNPETKYTYCAFAVTADGTTYGEEVEFTTLKEDSGDPDGINGIHISIDDENVEGIYSTSGQKLNSTVKSVNIIRYKDGTTKKVLVK